MKQLFLAIALILILTSVTGLIQPEKNEVSISGTDVFSIPVKIKNESGEKQLIHLISKSALKTEFAANDFYLNSGEETEIAFHIFPSYKTGVYYIELRMQYNDITEYSNLDVRIGKDTGSIDVRYFRQNVCQNQLDKLSLWIKNETGTAQRIKLSAESEMFMAVIEPNDIDLDAGEEKFVELEISSNKSFPLDEYSVTVYIESDDLIISKQVFFDLIECIEIQREFRLTAPADITVRKGETERVYFTVTNLDDKENEIEFAVRGKLKTELQQTKTVLAAHETRKYWIEVTAFNDTEVKTHLMELYAFNPFFEQRKTFDVSVRGIHETKTSLLNNELEIERGHSQIFTLLTENKGDFREKISLNFDELENINTHISETSFYLEKKELKKVYVSVNPAITSELGDYSLKVEVDGKELSLNFKVIEEKNPLKTDGVIEFWSVPEKITLNSDEKELNIAIKNISGEKIENIVFWIEGLPDGVSFQSEILQEIEKEKTKTITGKLFLDKEKAVKGNYEITMVFENSEFRQKKTIELIVLEEEKEAEKKEEKQEDSWFSSLAGFISLGSGQAIGLTVILVIIIILLLNPGQTQEKKGKTTWLNYKRGNKIE